MSEGPRYSTHCMVVFIHFVAFIITIYELGSRIIVAAAPGFPGILTSVFVWIMTKNFNIWRSTTEITTQRRCCAAMHWSEFTQWRVVATALRVNNIYFLAFITMWSTFTCINNCCWVVFLFWVFYLWCKLSRWYKRYQSQ